MGKFGLKCWFWIFLSRSIPHWSALKGRPGTSKPQCQDHFLSLQPPGLSQAPGCSRQPPPHCDRCQLACCTPSVAAGSEEEQGSFTGCGGRLGTWTKLISDGWGRVKTGSIYKETQSHLGGIMEDI